MAAAEEPDAAERAGGSSGSGRAPRTMAGVLFDVDDTLVDLGTAMRATVVELAAQLPAALDLEARRRAAELFAQDGRRRYHAYLAGELSFVEQRVARMRDACAALGVPLPDRGAPAEALAELWGEPYEQAMRRRWGPFDDVHPSLDALEAAGFAVGAVTNNVAAYQTEKLRTAGLERIADVVGIDAVGVVKPDPAIFHEGARRLGLAPEQCVYIGDDPAADGIGARDAGMLSVLVDRAGRHAEIEGVTKVNSLRAALDFVHRAGGRVE
ncbi:HAD family hydrolase [Nesterenkonia halobia]|uniref:HAD family hydrolase n=1 Tax=Nesterenkonia halobia TaxID=37922 RepID=A0ABP6RD80_9MICC